MQGMPSSSGSPDRRLSPRVPLADVLAGTLGLAAVVRVVDVSPAGVRIEHAAPLTPGQATVLDVALGGETFHLRTRVAWCHLYQVVTDSAGREIRYRAGLHFIDPPAAGGNSAENSPPRLHPRVGAAREPLTSSFTTTISGSG